MNLNPFAHIARKQAKARYARALEAHRSAVRRGDTRDKHYAIQALQAAMADRLRLGA